MVLVSHEDLVTNHDLTSWEINGGQLYSQDGDQRKSFLDKIWNILNSKTFHTVVILTTLAESFVVLVELLIGLRIIQDPWVDESSWCSCNSSEVAESSSGSDPNGRSQQQQSSSRNLLLAKDILSYTSIVILSLFLLEILLRVLSGKKKFLSQTAELCDGVVVILAFSLNLTFLLTSHKDNSNSDGKIAIVFIVLLRLWRISRLLQGIIHEAKREMGHIINAYKRDKIQAEHKVEILILKVEDLEHEVAYLKEKLKKFDRERSERKQRPREGSLMDGVISSRGHHHHHHHHHHHLDYEDDHHSLISYDSAPWKSVPILSFTCVNQQKPSPLQQLQLQQSQPHSPFHRPTMSLPVTPSPPSSTSGLPSPLTNSPVIKIKSPRRRKSQDGAELLEMNNSNLERTFQSSVNVELGTIAEEGGAKSKRTSAGVEQHDSGRGSSYTPGSTPRVSGHHRKENSEASSRCSPTNEITSGEAVENEIPTIESGLSPISIENDEEDDDDAQLDELSEIERVTKVVFHPTIERSKDVPVTVL